MARMNDQLPLQVPPDREEKTPPLRDREPEDRHNYAGAVIPSV
jgi:hypothetical protein